MLPGTLQKTDILTIFFKALKSFKKKKKSHRYGSKRYLNLLRMTYTEQRSGKA